MTGSAPQKFEIKTEKDRLARTNFAERRRMTGFEDTCRRAGVNKRVKSNAANSL